jgi:hypothetical protein
VTTTAAAKSAVVLVADAVLKELQATTLTLRPVYSRTYDTTQKLKDADTLHVDVIGAGHKLTPIARDTVARDPVVQIVVRKRLTNAMRDDDREELDRLSLLCEEIESHFAQRWLTNFDAAWQSTETVGPIDAPDYIDWRQFTEIISMTFRVDSED